MITAQVCRIHMDQTHPEVLWTDEPCGMPGKGELVVKIHLAALNPIDAKRSHGYGRRLFRLLGVCDERIEIGHDFVGQVVQVGAKVEQLRPGDRVMGVLPTGSQGCIRSHLVVQANFVRLLPVSANELQAVTLPYGICTLLAGFQRLGLDEQTARGKRVLILGAGGLGQLAIQLLTRWGCQVSVVCGSAGADLCMSLGAVSVYDRHGPLPITTRAVFDVTLNFGAWVDEVHLMQALSENGIGQMTTVHPLLANVDQFGWRRGLLQARRDFLSGRNRLRQRCDKGRYVWALFRPGAEAMNVAQQLLVGRAPGVALGPVFDRCQVRQAIAHVVQGLPGRAVVRCTSDSCE